MNLGDIKKVHFVGIGGIGMSALARLLLHDGKKVSGSDRSLSNVTDGLEILGIKIFEGHADINVTDDIDLVIYSEAVGTDSEGYVERKAAKKFGIPTINYFEALGLAVNPYYLIAVAGAHGKTTTTAMTTDVLEAGGLDPTAVVGSLRSKTGSNFRAGESKYAVVEACEYKRDFLHLEPDMLVITNIEEEHLDYYKDLADIQSAFRKLAKKVPEDGVVVCNPSDPAVLPVVEGLKCEIVDYTKCVDPLLKLKIPGMHNLYNAAAAEAVGRHFDISHEVAHEALEEFAGTWRRFEYKGETKGGALVYDDYAHHPTEIKASILGVRELYPDKRLTVVFQAHLHSRTAAFFDEFAETLSKADDVIIADIYKARNEDEHGVSGEKLAEAILKKNKNARYISSFEEITEKLLASKDAKDVIITMGAGETHKIADALTE